MKTVQTQLTITVPQQISSLLQIKAKNLGLSVAQLVNELVMNGVQYPQIHALEKTMQVSDAKTLLEGQNYPLHTLSKRSERRTKKALLEKEKAVDASSFFTMLRNNES
jgi:hypothetical protein